MSKNIPPKRTFGIGDTHWSQESICHFIDYDGNKVRPYENAQLMDEDMIQKWNETVRPFDKVYHFGDVAMHKKALSIMGKLNGDKVLIMGNHDIYGYKEYVKYFRDVRGSHYLNGYLLTHIPVHPSQKGRYKGNIHGHTHSMQVKDHNGIIDPWYCPVSCEHLGFRPMLMDEIFAMAEERHKKYPYEQPKRPEPTH